MLQEILNTNTAFRCDTEKVIDKLTDTEKPTPKEMASKLWDQINDSKYEINDSFTFEFVKGDYTFSCDVNTYNHSKEWVIACPWFTYKDEDFEDIGILEKIEIEMSKLPEIN